MLQQEKTIASFGGNTNEGESSHQRTLARAGRKQKYQKKLSASEPGALHL